MGRVGKPRGLGAQGFISEGMLLVSRDAHFTPSQKQLSAPTHHKLHPRSSWHAKWFPPPPFTLNFFLLSGSSILQLPPYSTSSPIVPLSVVVAHQHSLSPQPSPSFLLSPFAHTSRPSVSPVCFVTAGQSFSSRPY